MNRIIVAIVAATLGSAEAGCAGAMRGGEDDLSIHGRITLDEARRAGWSPDQAATIAGANVHTDYHPDTTSVATERRLAGGLLNPVSFPWIVCGAVWDFAAEGLTPKRALGRRTAQATAWTVPTLAHKLHFPGKGLYDPTERAFIREDETNEWRYGNRTVRVLLEHAFLRLTVRDPDEARSLSLLGIALHTLQDAQKHQGHCAAFGHIGEHPDPDHPASDPKVTSEIEELSYLTLRHARLLYEKGRVRHDVSAQPPCATVRREWKEAEDDWKAAGGVEAFERALEIVRRICR